jgi:hypothetical protein
MIRIELSQEEANMLSEVIESHLSDLRMEIAHTDNTDFRAGLKRREAFLNDLLAGLNTGPLPDGSALR